MRSRQQIWWSYLGLLILSVLMIGCSLDPYKQPVTALVDATTKASSASDTLLDSTVKARTTFVERQLLDVSSGWFVQKASSDDCEENSQHCRLQAGPASGGSMEPFPATSTPFSRFFDVTGGLIKYAQALSDIVNADTATKIESSITTAAGSINTLSSAVTKAHDDAVANLKDAQQKATQQGDQNGAAKAAQALEILSKSPTESRAEEASAYATPVGKAFSWIAGQYVAYRQIAALRYATGKAKSQIEKAGPILDAMLYVAAAETRINASREEKSSLHDFQVAGNRTLAMLTRLETASSSAEQVLAASGSGVFTSMVTAHDGLACQLAIDPVSLQCPKDKAPPEDISTALQTFSARADELFTIASAFQGAADQLRKQQQQQ